MVTLFFTQILYELTQSLLPSFLTLDLGFFFGQQGASLLSEEAASSSLARDQFAMLEGSLGTPVFQVPLGTSCDLVV